jgi:hypothetical protein
MTKSKSKKKSKSKAKPIHAYWKGKGLPGSMPTSVPPDPGSPPPFQSVAAAAVPTSPSTDTQLARVSPNESIFTPKQMTGLKISNRPKLLPSQARAIFASKAARKKGLI